MIEAAIRYFLGATLVLPGLPTKTAKFDASSGFVPEPLVSCDLKHSCNKYLISRLFSVVLLRIFNYSEHVLRAEVSFLIWLRFREEAIRCARIVAEENRIGFYGSNQSSVRYRQK
jgi:hypothetical protein